MGVLTIYARETWNAPKKNPGRVERKIMKSKTIMGMSLALLLGVGLVACDTTTSSTVPSESSEEQDTTTSSTVPSESSESSSQEQGTIVNMGETLQLTTTLTGTAVWSSSNDAVASVSETGLVTAITPGEVTITATSGEQTETFELTIVDPNEDVNGSIIVDYDNLPTEITAGSTVDLDDYVNVSNVDNWYLTTQSTDIVSISGHTVTALTAGDFTVTICAGRTRRAYNGTVITEAKQIFNTFFESIQNNYIAYSEFYNLTGVTDNYYYYINDYISDDGQTITAFELAGGIYDEDKGAWRNYTVHAVPESNTSLKFVADEETLEITPGYGRSKENYGLTTPDYDVTAIKELLYNGQSVGMFYATEDTNGSLAALLDGLTGGAWSTILYYVTDQNPTADVNGAAFYYNVDQNTNDPFITVLPATITTYNGQPYAMTYDSVLAGMTDGSTQELGTYIQISNVDLSGIDVLDGWVESPVAPTEIDISPLDAFFDKMAEEKSYTQITSGKWVDTTTGEQVETPSGMQFIDTHQDIFSSIDITTYANESGIYTRYDGLNGNNIWAEPDTMGIGDTNLVNNNAVLTFNVQEGETSSVYEATGTYDPEQGTTKFNVPERQADSNGNPIDSDIWTESSYVPSNIFGHSNPVENEDGTSSTMFELTSFYATKAEEDGSTTYYTNHYGPDTAYSYASNYLSLGAAGTNFFMLYNTNYAFGFWTMVYLAQTGYIYDYVTTSWNLSADAGTLTYNVDLRYSSNIHYVVTVTMSGIGEDNMPQEAKDLITQTAGV